MVYRPSAAKIARYVLIMMIKPFFGLLRPRALNCDRSGARLLRNMLMNSLMERLRFIRSPECRWAPSRAECLMLISYTSFLLHSEILYLLRTILPAKLVSIPCISYLPVQVIQQHFDYPFLLGKLLISIFQCTTII